MKRFLFRRLLGLSLVGLSAVAAEPAPAKPAPRAFAAVSLGSPRAIALDASGNLFVVDVDSSTVTKLTPSGQDSVVPTAPIKGPFGVAVNRAGTVFVVDADDNAVYRLGQDGATALAKSELTTPTSLVVDSAGNVFVADNGNQVVRKIGPDGKVTTFAGTPHEGGTRDGTGADARFGGPRGIAIDGKDNLYVADEANNTVRKITPAGVVSTLAGRAGSAGNTDGTGANAFFGAPRGLAADAAGTVYVADTDNHTIRKVTPAGVVTTLAGMPGTSGHADGTGSAARFSEPRGVAVDAAGNVFVADSGNGAIRQITPDGVVTTIAATRKP